MRDTMRELVVTSKLSDFDLHTYLGWMYQREGDNMKAIEYFQKALSHSIHEFNASQWRSSQKRFRRMLDSVFPNCGKLPSSWVLALVLDCQANLKSLG